VTDRSRIVKSSLDVGQGRRVLVVDDDPLNRKLAKLRLREAGFAVDTADTAETALKMASNTPPHAILSDIRMPGMDGFQFRQAVLHDPRLARIPVLLFSTEVADEQTRRGEGVDRYCVVRSPDLREAIAALVAALADAPAE
jgi:CheY-like chemotaxis protein